MTETRTTAWQNKTEDEIRTAARDLVIELSPKSEKTSIPDGHLVDDLEYHSLALLELAFALEDEFDLPQISEETAREIRTVRAVEEHVIGALRSDGRLR